MGKQRTKRYCERIAKLYGVRLYWIKGDDAWYWTGGNCISVGRDADDREIISMFCHELGHYLNFVEGKYPLYHQKRNAAYDFLRYFKSKTQAARYALNAELYTDKRGSQLCRQWFPYTKYIKFYRNNKTQLNMLKAYLFT